MRKLLLLSGTIAGIACGDKLAGVPNAGALDAVPVTYGITVVPDSLAPPSSIIASGDSVRFTAITRPVCGRDTLTAGVSHDSVVVTYVQTALPLPCAVVNGSIRIDGVVRNLPTPPRAAVLTYAEINGTHTDRSILAVAPRQ